ncbi:MAG: hypothetical protein JWQ35_1976 [Bacteriovoracaceae bacterium]|nr:hypothetical protein [Bacteriovoracaceae bacterium]
MAAILAVRIRVVHQVIVRAVRIQVVHRATVRAAHIQVAQVPAAVRVAPIQVVQITVARLLAAQLHHRAITARALLHVRALQVAPTAAAAHSVDPARHQKNLIQALYQNRIRPAVITTDPEVQARVLRRAKRLLQSLPQAHLQNHKLRVALALHRARSIALQRVLKKKPRVQKLIRRIVARMSTLRSKLLFKLPDLLQPERVLIALRLAGLIQEEAEMYRSPVLQK